MSPAGPADVPRWARWIMVAMVAIMVVAGWGPRLLWGLWPGRNVHRLAGRGGGRGSVCEARQPGPVGAVCVPRGALLLPWLAPHGAVASPARRSGGVRQLLLPVSADGERWSERGPASSRCVAFDGEPHASSSTRRRRDPTRWRWRRASRRVGADALARDGGAARRAHVRGVVGAGALPAHHVRRVRAGAAARVRRSPRAARRAASTGAGSRAGSASPPSCCCRWSRVARLRESQRRPVAVPVAEHSATSWCQSARVRAVRAGRVRGAVAGDEAAEAADTATALEDPAARPALELSLVWLLAPPLILFAARTSSARRCSSIATTCHTVAAQALIVAILFRGFPPTLARFALLACFLPFAIMWGIQDGAAPDGPPAGGDR